MNQETQAKFADMRDQLRSQFVERDDQIVGAFCAILSKQHMFMVGPPGTAKSMLIDAICKRVEGAEYFQWLLTKFSTPEEIFGPISLKALEEDEYKRITHNKLPEAHIAFLDECFKANSAILNSLLTVINERKYHNNGAPVDIPLQSMFGASNELPDGEELGALYDRLLLRFVVPYIADDSDFKRMLTLSDKKLLLNLNTQPQNPGPIRTTITLSELELAQAEVDTISIPDELFDQIIQIRNELNKEGVVNSDRRYNQAMDVLKAHAYLNGRTAVGDEDLEILQHILWGQLADIKVVQRVIIGTANPLMNKILELMDQAHEINKEAQDQLASNPDESTTYGVEANTKLKKIGAKLLEHRETAISQNRSTQKIDDSIEIVTNLNTAVLKDLLGVNVT